MRRSIVAVIFLLSCLPAVVFAQGFKYVLKGKVSNWSSPAKAYLIYSTKAKVQVDSTAIVGGRFSFHAMAMAQNTEPFLVVTKSGNRMARTGVKAIRFYTDAPSISIVISDSLDKITVKGGKLNKDDTALTAALAPVEEKIQKATELYADSSDLEARLAVLEKEKKAICLQFIKSHPNSFISLIALSKLGGHNPDFTEVQGPFNSLSPAIRSTKEGLAYAAQLKELKKVAIGQPAPDFTLHDTTGKAVSLHDFKGKYVLIDFWASWCPPCRAESPFIAEAFAAYKSRNFTVLGVSLDNPDKKHLWMKAIRDDRLTWTQVSSTTGFNNEAAKAYSVTSIPRNFLIAPDGKIVAKDLRGRALMEKLKEIIGE